MNVQNNVAPSVISMDSMFQGCFSAQAKLSQVIVQDKNTSQTIDFDTKLPDLAMGSVGNDPKPSYLDTCRSYIYIVSALGPVNLIFGS